MASWGLEWRRPSLAPSAATSLPSAPSQDSIAMRGAAHGAGMSWWARGRVRAWLEKTRARLGAAVAAVLDSNPTEAAAETELEHVAATLGGGEGVFVLAAEAARELFEAKCLDLGQPATPEGFDRFRAGLARRFRGPHTLDLSSSSLGPRAAAVLRRHLAVDTDLHELLLANNPLGDVGVATIAQLLQENHRIVAVDLSGVEMGPPGFASLAEALPLTCVQTLRASSTQSSKNTLGAKGAASLATALAHPACKIRALYLGAVAPGNFLHLATGGLACSRSLEHLDLQMNRLDDAAVAKLCAALVPTMVSALNLSHNTVHEGACAALVTLLRDSTALRHLHLASCMTAGGARGVTNQHSTRFFKQLRALLERPNGCYLESLVFDGNELSDEAMAELSPGLMHNTSLRALSLASCGLMAKSASALADALAANGTLTELNLRDNALGDEGVTALCIKMNHTTGSLSTLVSLNLSNNFVGDAGAVAAAEMLENNDTLRELSLQQNLVRDEGARRLIVALTASESRSVLVSLHCRLNGFSHALVVKLQAVLAERRSAERERRLSAQRRELQRLKRDEARLKEVEAALAELEGEMKRSEALRSEHESTIEQWKNEQEAMTQAMAEELAQLVQRAELEHAQVEDTKRTLLQELRNRRIAFQDQSGTLAFKVATEKRKQYNRMELIHKHRTEIAERLKEHEASEAFERELEGELSREREACEKLRGYHSEAADKASELRQRLLSEYRSGMAEFRERLADAQQRHDKLESLRFGRSLAEVQQVRAASATSVRMDGKDTAKFIRWYFGGRPELRVDTGHERKQSAVPFIGLQEELTLHVRVARRPEDTATCGIIQKSHTVQSLSMHGLHQFSTLWCTLVDGAPKPNPQPLDATLRVPAQTIPGDGREDGDGEHASVTVRVAGSTTVPLLAHAAAEALGLRPEHIRALLFDPDQRPATPQSVRQRRAEARRADFERQCVEAAAEQARLAEERRRRSDLDEMQRAPSAIGDFSEKTRGELEQLDRRIRSLGSSEVHMVGHFDAPQEDSLVRAAAEGTASSLRRPKTGKAGARRRSLTGAARLHQQLRAASALDAAEDAKNDAVEADAEQAEAGPQEAIANTGLESRSTRRAWPSTTARRQGPVGSPRDAPATLGLNSRRLQVVSAVASGSSRAIEQLRSAVSTGTQQQQQQQPQQQQPLQQQQGPVDGSRTRSHSTGRRLAVAVVRPCVFQFGGLGQRGPALPAAAPPAPIRRSQSDNVVTDARAEQTSEAPELQRRHSLPEPTRPSGPETEVASEILASAAARPSALREAKLLSEGAEEAKMTAFSAARALAAAELLRRHSLTRATPNALLAHWQEASATGSGKQQQDGVRVMVGRLPFISATK